MSKDIFNGSTGNRATLLILEAGEPKTGVAWNAAGLVIAYRIDTGSQVAITLSSGNWFEIGAGKYVVDVADSVYLAANLGKLIQFYGTLTDCAVYGEQHRVVANDPLVLLPTAATIGAAVWEVLTSTLNTAGSTGRALARLIGLVEDSDGDRLTAKALEVIDSAAAPTAAEIAAEVERTGGMLALVKAKTDLITAGGVTILSPVAQGGTLNNLVVGDAYQLAAGRAIEITVEDVTAGLQTILESEGATVHLGFLRYGKSRQNPEFRRYEFPGTIVSVGADTVVRFDLTTEDTRDIVPSKYDYDIEFRQNSNYVTSVANAKGRPMEWLESATELG